ncbi:uncharacterized protein LOC103512048 [Diaphorina citri]|uniref:Uncharacterized protein LOC103512048 n=1 Tax=Diaphorina citri TaxID=121845 RepID=A0A3Q0IZ19_DIACI|nr:uncharacterized protein LOC103512048 [Diaphorina citri]
MVYQFSFEELTDIHFCYGLADGNANLARRLYQDKYPNRHLPNNRTFTSVHTRLRERGTFKTNHGGNSGRERTTREVHVEEDILEAVDNDPTISTREISVNLGISQSAVWRTLHENLFYPYHLQRVQGLLERDFGPRLQFSRWVLVQIATVLNFVSSILFTDEANFSRDGITNFHNNHIWAMENPHGIVQKNHQQTFSWNVWAGIIGDTLLGPFFLPPILNGDNYLDFLREHLMDMIPLEYRQRGVLFMHDGAPAHYRITVRQFLDEMFPRGWIGRGGPHPWPARSPEFNPLDFFLWGYVKSLVYRTPVPDRETLRIRIIEAFNTIRNTPGIFQRVRQSFQRRMEACTESGGAHIEHVL